MDDKVASIPQLMVQEVMKISEVIIEHKLQLKRAFGGNPVLESLLMEITSSVKRALSSVNKVQMVRPSPVGSPSSADVMPNKKRKINSNVERSSASCLRIITAKTLDDGQTWRKYGQKDIHSAKNPRSYFRCTHKNDQGCSATRHVQVSEEDNSSYIIKYFGKHTCKDPSIVSQILHDSNYKDSCLISFENINEKYITRQAAPIPTVNTLPSLTDEYYCIGEELLSNNLTHNNSSSEYFLFPEADDQQGLAAILGGMANNGDVSSGFQFGYGNFGMDLNPYQFELDNEISFIKW